MDVERQQCIYDVQKDEQLHGPDVPDMTASITMLPSALIKTMFPVDFLNSLIASNELPKTILYSPESQNDE